MSTQSTGSAVPPREPDGTLGQAQTVHTLQRSVKSGHSPNRTRTPFGLFAVGYREIPPCLLSAPIAPKTACHSIPTSPAQDRKKGSRIRRFGTMNDRLTQISKFLSYVLRHNPGALDLTVAPGGWVDVSTLVARAREDGRTLHRTQIRQVIAATEKNRFTLSDDGSKIRANYGHSIDVDLDLSPTVPPDRLYHGTTRQALSSIQNEGLRPQSRQYVHLSTAREEAVDVGQRHGTPVVLPIDARALHDAGHTLYHSADSVWLTRHVPASFIQFPEA